MKKILIIAFIIILLTMISYGCVSEQEPEIRPIKSCQLINVQQQSTSGNFILFVGTYSSDIISEIRYYMYIKGNEGYRLQYIPSDNLEIVETNEIEPCIKGVFNSDGKINEYTTDDGQTFCWNDYIVYVPIGTIYQEYNISLNNINN